MSLSSSMAPVDILQEIVRLLNAGELFIKRDKGDPTWLWFRGLGVDVILHVTALYLEQGITLYPVEMRSRAYGNAIAHLEDHFLWGASLVSFEPDGGGHGGLYFADTQARRLDIDQIEIH